LGNKVFGQVFGCGAGEKAGVGVNYFLHLLAHRGQHIGVVVPEAGNRRPAGCVDIGLTLSVDDEHALAAGGDRIGMGELAVDNARHGGSVGGLFAKGWAENVRQERDFLALRQFRRHYSPSAG